MAASPPINTGAFPPFLATAPIFFVSTHGAYLLNKDTMPFRVPENTIIIDTVDIGEVCLTSIDTPLWNLMQGVNRDKLIRYMKGVPDPSDSQTEQENYLRIFNNIHIYFPGDPVYSRALSIGPGKRMDYKNMGFFKFKVGDPTNVFNNSNNMFVQSGIRSKILRSLERELVLDADKIINYEYFLQSTNRELTDSVQRIFIFSSCGARWSGSHEQIENVQRVQEAARLKFMGMRSETEKFGRAFDIIDVDAGAGAAGWSKVPKGLRGEVPEEFAPGAFNENTSTNNGMYFENRSGAPLTTTRGKTAPGPVKGEQLFYKKPGTSDFLTLHHDDGTLLFTPSQVNIMKQRLPGIQLFKLVKGKFVALRGGGGSGSRGTRRLSKRVNRPSHRRSHSRASRTR